MNYEPEVFNYIKQNIESNGEVAPCTYALVDVRADEKDVPILFNLMPDCKGGEWVLESPCSLMIYGEAPTRDKFIEECKADENWEEFSDDTPEDYYDYFIAPMIVEGIWYDIDVPQTGPFLPDEVDGITFLSGREMLLWLIEHKTGKKPQDVVFDN